MLFDCRCRWSGRGWGKDADGGSGGDHARQGDNIPVGHAETAVRFGAANGFRRWGPMDAEARLTKTDPIDAYRIVGARGED